jgi:hypothetical protein
MPSIEVDIAPPTNWQDFERLTLDYARIHWKNDYAERNGRQGQAQAGVDVYGYNYSANEWTGIQCKKKNNSAAPSKGLTTSEIDKEVQLAEAFNSNLGRFIIATTGPRDAKLQVHVRALNQARRPFKVSLMFWDDFQDFLNNDSKLMYRYYQEVLEYRQKYNPLEQYLLLLRSAFDRPALNTPFHLENRAKDFIKAISDTQRAISTGILVDRESHVVDECRPPQPKIANLTKAAKHLKKAREIATKALSDGVIVEHETVIEIRSHEVATKLNDHRRSAIELLNDELSKHQLDVIDHEL